MFFFGLLSTHLPYILLGVLYVVSFGLLSMQALSAQEISKSEIRQWDDVSQHQDLLEHSSTFHFNDYPSFQKFIHSDPPIVPDVLYLKLQEALTGEIFAMVAIFSEVHQFGRPPTA